MRHDNDYTLLLFQRITLLPVVVVVGVGAVGDVQQLPVSSTTTTTTTLEDDCRAAFAL